MLIILNIAFAKLLPRLDKRNCIAWPSFTALKASDLVIDWHRGRGKITDFTADLDTLKIGGSGTIDLSTLQFLLDVNGQVIGTYHALANNHLSDPACAVNAKYKQFNGQCLATAD